MLVIMTLVHHSAVFMLDAWSLNGWWMTLIRIVCSSAATIVLLLTFDRLRHA
jgi:hypothetical protein